MLYPFAVRLKNSLFVKNSRLTHGGGDYYGRMTESTGFGIIYAFFGITGGAAFFALTAGATAVGFFICLFLSVFKCGYGLKKRLWFLILLSIFCALLRTRALTTGEKDLSPLLSCFGLILFLPVYFIRVKAPKDKADNLSAREFVRILDGKIKRADDSEKTQADFRAEVLKADVKPPVASDKPDFSHVKNVLQRLEPAALSCADRRQIRELELSICEAENGGYSEETRVKINEGLGNLLKIMARHGV